MSASPIRPSPSWSKTAKPRSATAATGRRRRWAGAPPSAARVRRRRRECSPRGGRSLLARRVRQCRRDVAQLRLRAPARSLAGGRSPRGSGTRRIVRRPSSARSSLHLGITARISSSGSMLRTAAGSSSSRTSSTSRSSRSAATRTHWRRKARRIDQIGGDLKDGATVVGAHVWRNSALRTMPVLDAFVRRRRGLRAASKWRNSPSRPTARLSCRRRAGGTAAASFAAQPRCPRRRLRRVHRLCT